MSSPHNLSIHFVHQKWQKLSYFSYKNVKTWSIALIHSSWIDAEPQCSTPIYLDMRDILSQCLGKISKTIFAKLYVQNRSWLSRSELWGHQSTSLIMGYHIGTGKRHLDPIFCENIMRNFHEVVITFHYFSTHISLQCLSRDCLCLKVYVTAFLLNRLQVNHPVIDGVPLLSIHVSTLKMSELHGHTWYQRLWSMV